MKYNSIMRAGTGVPFLVGQRDKLCLGNSYTTTLHIISSSIVKLGKLTRAEKVFRGIAGGVLPEEFWVPNKLNVRGGVEYAQRDSNPQSPDPAPAAC